MSQFTAYPHTPIGLLAPLRISALKEISKGWGGYCFESSSLWGTLRDPGQATWVAWWVRLALRGSKVQRRV